MRNQIAIKVGLKQNRNTKSAAYGKYYAEVQNNETLSTRGLLEHIMSHGLGVIKDLPNGKVDSQGNELTTRSYMSFADFASQNVPNP